MSNETYGNYNSAELDIPTVKFAPAPDLTGEFLGTEKTGRAQLPNKRHHPARVRQTNRRDPATLQRYSAEGLPRGNDIIKEFTFDIGTDAEGYDEGLVTSPDGTSVRLDDDESVLFERIATAPGLGSSIEDLARSIGLPPFDTTRMVEALAERLNPKGTSPVIMRNDFPTQIGDSRFAFGLHPGAAVVESSTEPLPSRH